MNLALMPECISFLDLDAVDDDLLVRKFVMKYWVEELFIDSKSESNSNGLKKTDV